MEFPISGASAFGTSLRAGQRIAPSAKCSEPHTVDDPSPSSSGAAYECAEGGEKPRAMNPTAPDLPQLRRKEGGAKCFLTGRM